MLVFSSVMCSAVDYMIETVGDETLIYLSVPYSMFNFRHKNGKYFTEARVDVSIYDKRRKLKYNETSTVVLHFSSRSDIDKRRYPVLMLTDIKKGQYLLKLKIKSVNYKKDFQVHLRRNKDYENVSSLYAYCYSDSSVYEPWVSGADSDSIEVVHYSETDGILSLNSDPVKTSNYEKIQGTSLYKAKMCIQKSDLAELFKFTPEDGDDILMKYQTSSSAYRFRQSYTGEEQLRQLLIIERSDLIKKLKKLDKDDLKLALDSYWIQTDRTTGDRVNEFQLAFYRAIKFCNEKFGILGYRMGWDTDMGRTYLEYGQPDDIVNEAYPRAQDYEDLFSGDVLTAFYDAVRDFNSIQIWYYFKENKVFLFIEKHGANYYELQN